MKNTKTYKILLVSMTLVILLSTLIPIAGCEKESQTGALTGAGVGAVAGQVIGGDTKGTMTGAAIGAGVGYVIGKSKEDDDD